MKTRPTMLRFAAIAMFAFATGQADAVTVQFQEGVSPDGTFNHAATYLRQGQATTNFDDNSLLTGFNSSGSALSLRPILAYDLTAGLAPGMTLSDIALSLIVDGDRDDMLIDIFELTPGGDVNNLFVESEATWNEYASGSPWSTAGGDFDPLSPLATVDTTGNTSDGSTVTFSSTPAFLSAAQAAYDAARPFQFILVSQSEGSNALMDFDDDSNATPANRPLLTVTAAPADDPQTAPVVPEPATAVLAMFALGAVAARRRG